MKSGVIDKKHLGSEQRARILLVSLEQELIYLCTPRVHTTAVLLGLSLYGESPETRVVKEQVHSHLWKSILVCHLGFLKKYVSLRETEHERGRGRERGRHRI